MKHLLPLLLWLLGCSGASGIILGPYQVDSATLHLWHLDETSVPALDSVPGGTNLTTLGGSAALGQAALAGFGTALSTAATTGDYLAPRALVNGTGDNTAMTYADASTGAFTIEALLRVDFNPAAFNRGNVPQYLVMGENDAGDRPWQFRIHTNGVVGSGVLQLQFFNLIGVGNTPFVAAIPNSGPDAILQGNWYHVAVTYNGAAAGGHLKFYWTRVEPSRVQASLLASFTMPNLVPMAVGAIDFSIGNVGRTTPNGNFVGLIDEVRLSSVARSAGSMMFASTNPVIATQPASQSVQVSNIVSLSVVATGQGPLSYQWRRAGADLPGATQATFLIESVQPVHAGDYQVVITNTFGAVTSEVATITVLVPEQVFLAAHNVGNSLSLQWPTQAFSMALFCADNLDPQTVWQLVTNAPAVSGTNFLLTRLLTERQKFYRLLPAPPAHAVRPIDWNRFTAGLPADANAQQTRLILSRACSYAMSTWWTTHYASQDAAEYLNLGGTGETQVRRPAMEAYGLAVALQTGIYDPVPSEVSTAVARARTLKLVRSLGYRHLANQPGGWGNVWQSPHWAALTGTAAWLLWEALLPTDQEYVRRMVEYEANRFNNYTVTYYRNKAGAIVSPGDTKAEENAWHASVLHLALCMMPAHTNAVGWWNKALELSLSAHARPSDVSATNIFHGRPLSAWLNGSNANEDSTVINHNLVHPDYMVAGLCEFQPALVYLLAGRPVPAAGFFNLDQAYRALVDLNFEIGAIPYATGLTNRPPGGPMYMRNTLGEPTGNIYYPNGNDWGTSRRMHFATFDATARAFSIDNLATIPAPIWEAQHNQAVLDMQARFTDGRTYGAASEDTYGLREEWVCNYAAKSFLTQWLVHQAPVQITNDP